MTSIVSRYRVLPELAGRSFLPIAFAARLPLSMTQIGVVVLVSTSFDSIAAGGLAAGFLALGAAACGPIIGLLAGRYGQRAVMLAASLLNAAAVLAVVGLVLGRSPSWSVYAAAALAGASTPQVGPLVRARWVRMTTGGKSLSYAMSYEGAADETAYVLGPAAVSVLALLGSPALALVASALLVGIFGSAVALHPSASQNAAGTFHPAAEAGGAKRLLEGRLLLLTLVAATVGCFFGSMQTGVTAVAAGADIARGAGGIYAIMGVGSAVAALGTAALPTRFTLPQRLVAFSGVLAIVQSPLLFLTGLLPTVLVLVPLGCAIGPYLITVFSLAERLASPRRVAAVMTVLTSGMVVGSAIGSSVGGSLVDGDSASGAFALASIALVVGVLSAGAFAAVIGRGSEDSSAR